MLPDYAFDPVTGEVLSSVIIDGISFDEFDPDEYYDHIAPIPED